MSARSVAALVLLAFFAGAIFVLAMPSFAVPSLTDTSAHQKPAADLRSEGFPPAQAADARDAVAPESTAPAAPAQPAPEQVLPRRDASDTPLGDTFTPEPPSAARDATPDSPSPPPNADPACVTEHESGANWNRTSVHCQRVVTTSGNGSSGTVASSSTVTSVSVSSSIQSGSR